VNGIQLVGTERWMTLQRGRFREIEER